MDVNNNGYRSNWDDITRSSLVCPACTASNRPGAAVIEVYHSVAFCNVCAFSGPLVMFILKEIPT